MKLSAMFKRFASAASRATGKPITFVLAATIVVVWALTGPLFGYSDTWQLVINTGTTIITFLMVFLIQNTQNRDSEAMHIKMDEMIRAIEGAHNALLDLEELEDDELDTIRKRYHQLAKKARDDSGAGGREVGCDDIAGGDTPEELPATKKAQRSRSMESTASNASAGSNFSLSDVNRIVPDSLPTLAKICVPSSCMASESWSAVFVVVPSLNICPANAATPSLSAGSKLVAPPMKSMFSAMSGRSCFSTTMSSAPFASLVFVHVGT